MTIQGVQLAPEGSGVGALAFGSGRADLDDEALAAVQAVSVGVGVGIVLDEAGLVDLVLGQELDLLDPDALRGDSSWGATLGLGLHSSRKAWGTPSMIKGGTRRERSVTRTNQTEAEGSHVVDVVTVSLDVRSARDELTTCRKAGQSERGRKP